MARSSSIRAFTDCTDTRQSIVLGPVQWRPSAIWSRQRLIILMSAGWFAGAVLGGEVVWRKGTDSLRVFAALWPLMALAAIVAVREHRRRPAGEN